VFDSRSGQTKDFRARTCGTAVDCSVLYESLEMGASDPPLTRILRKECTSEYYKIQHDFKF